MIYLDASALTKRYFDEKGSEVVADRFEHGEIIFTSVISFAEVHAAFARKFRHKEIDKEELARLRDEFQNDWLFSLSKVEVDLMAMIDLPRLVETYPLKAGDAIHLSAALWLKNSLRVGAITGQAVETVVFGVADRQLSKIAAECGLNVFDPEQNI